MATLFPKPDSYGTYTNPKIEKVGKIAVDKENKIPVKKVVNKVKKESKLIKLIKSKLSNKPVIKESKVSYNLSKTETEPGEYQNRFFKEKYEEEKKNFFFK